MTAQLFNISPTMVDSQLVLWDQDQPPLTNDAFSNIIYLENAEGLSYSLLVIQPQVIAGNGNGWNAVLECSTTPDFSAEVAEVTPEVLLPLDAKKMSLPVSGYGIQSIRLALGYQEPFLYLRLSALRNSGGSGDLSYAAWLTNGDKTFIP